MLRTAKELLYEFCFLFVSLRLLVGGVVCYDINKRNDALSLGLIYMVAAFVNAKDHCLHGDACWLLRRKSLPNYVRFSYARKYWGRSNTTGVASHEISNT
jgi:hypothetical protein